MRTKCRLAHSRLAQRPSNFDDDSDARLQDQSSIQAPLSPRLGMLTSRHSRRVDLAPPWKRRSAHLILTRSRLCPMARIDAPTHESRRSMGSLLVLDDITRVSAPGDLLLRISEAWTGKPDANHSLLRIDETINELIIAPEDSSRRPNCSDDAACRSGDGSPKVGRGYDSGGRSSHEGCPRCAEPGRRDIVFTLQFRRSVCPPPCRGAGAPRPADPTPKS